MACAKAPTSSWLRVYPNWGVTDEATHVEGFGCCLRNVEADPVGAPKGVESGAKTLWEVLQKSVEKFPDRECSGHREIVKVHWEEGREKIELKNEFKWTNYRDYQVRVENLGCGMAKVGNLQPNEKVVIYAETQEDWMITAFAAWRNGATVATIYATLGEEGAEYGINQTKACIVVADARLCKILGKILPKCPTVRTVITLGAVSDFKAPDNVTVLEIKEVEATGKANPTEAKTPKPSDVAVVMYTSGTTGNPKGVMLSHLNIVAAVANCEAMSKFGAITENETYLAYLPLAHIFELLFECSCINWGCRMGFGSAHTLTDKGLKLKRPESNGDAPTLEPTIMIFAPAVLDKIYVGVKANFAELATPIRTLAEWGVANGAKRFEDGFVGANSFYNSVIFKKVQRLVGGKLKLAIAGSAPLSPDIQKFVSTIFNCPLRQGYGLTETCAASTVQFWGDSSVNSVGPPTMNNVIRLADWPEGNYMNSDKDTAVGMRRGEVLIGGDQVSLGYYIDSENPDPEIEKKNAEDWVEIKGVRFFRTGDIAQITATGCLQIIDRKKDLWKGPQGEYVAFAKVESALKNSKYTQVPMCYGKTGAQYPIALICPQKPRIVALGQELGLNEEYEALCLNSKVVEAVSNECLIELKKAKIQAFETPKKFLLISDEWTPFNDCMTAAMKLKRPIITGRHQKEIDEAYAAN